MQALPDITIPTSSIPNCGTTAFVCIGETGNIYAAYLRGLFDNYVAEVADDTNLNELWNLVRDTTEYNKSDICVCGDAADPNLLEVVVKLADFVNSHDFDTITVQAPPRVTVICIYTETLDLLPFCQLSVSGRINLLLPEKLHLTEWSCNDTIYKNIVSFSLLADMLNRRSTMSFTPARDTILSNLNYPLVICKTLDITEECDDNLITQTIMALHTDLSRTMHIGNVVILFRFPSENEITKSLGSAFQKRVKLLLSDLNINKYTHAIEILDDDASVQIVLFFGSSIIWNNL